MKIIFLLLALGLSYGMFSQAYNVALIPDSLKKNANVVIRYEEKIIEIKSPGKAVEKERHVYTVLNESAAHYGRYVTYYDRFSSINAVTCTLFDEHGKEMKRARKKDMLDRSVDDQMSLMLDTRAKENDFYCHSYPYTVDFEEEDDIDGIRDFSDWVPLPAPSLSVQHSRYVIIAPKDYLVRYKSNNAALQPVITEEGNKKTYTWEIKNLPAVAVESNAPLFRELVPYVMVAPSDFEAEGYKGNMSTWEAYGKFIYQLVKGRDVLPENIKAKVHELTNGLKDDRQKVYALYDFLQKNTRYISIQLGIGGWQPFDATYVATRRYGDCKALSNYMVSLLKEAGITGKYVEIMAGENAAPMIEDFPCSQFNHAIACVPMGKDTVWLECTDQTKSAGYMGSFTGDRKALIIDEGGGHVVKTPAYTAADNVQLRLVNAVIDADGNLDANVHTKLMCIQQETAHQLMYEANKDQRDSYLNRSFNLATYTVDKSNFEEEKGLIPAMQEYLHITATAYASVTGKRLFIAPNLFDKTTVKYSADDVRKYDIVFDAAFKAVDSIVIKIPAGFTPESVPAALQLNSRFGKYACHATVEADKIVYYRMEEKSRNRFPAADYAELVKFQDQVYRADRARIVLVKKDN